MFTITVFSLCLVAVWTLPPPKVPKPHSQFNPWHANHTKIVNGNRATEGQFPWQAAVTVTESNSYSWMCGGVIISEDWILTAGLCLYNGVSARIITGSTSTQNGIVTTASEIIVHEDFHSATLEHDIGLLKLRQPLQLNANTAPVALSDEPLEDGVTVRVSGYGSVANDVSTFSLYFTDLITITNTQCNDIYGVILEGMVCAISDTEEIKGICFGDAGGPAITNPESEPLLVAVISFLSDFGCETSQPSGFTRVAKYRDWIKEKTGI